MKVALVHEWLITHGGSEEITAQLLALFPDADLFALLADPVPSLRAAIGDRRVTTSFLQFIPGATRSHRTFLPLMARGIESFDLRGYDLVISVSHAVAKSVRTAPGQLHLCICCSPMRYAWDLREQYLVEAGMASGIRGVVVRAILERIRKWDLRTADRPTRYAAISKFIGERIQRAYGRSSSVLYPPVDTDYFCVGDGEPRLTQRTQRGNDEDAEDNWGNGNGNGDGYGNGDRSSPEVLLPSPASSQLSSASSALKRLQSPLEKEPGLYVAASRMVPYKRMPLIVEAFRSMPDLRLVVIGDGPELAKVKAAAGANVTVLGHQPREALRDWLRRAEGFVFAAEEDFGILPVEAMACGTPVVAYGVGGVRETVVGLGVTGEAPTGVFFQEQTAPAIAAGVRALGSAVRSGTITAAACRARAERFSVATFRAGVARELAALGLAIR